MSEKQSLSNSHEAAVRRELSPRLVRLLDDIFPGSTHTFDADELFSNDVLIWDFAKRNNFAIISKDADFERLSALYGAPPKVIWVRIGNGPTSEVEQALRANCAAIQRFIQDPGTALCVIDA